jgi:AcrR family transcriptional regulator
VTTRAYDSPLRAEQAVRTRERILEAFAEQMAEAGDEFSIPRVAKRAGVSLRTVYHHFPNREAQVEALAEWIERTTGTDEGPRDVADLPAYAERRYAKFFEHEQLMRAQLAAGIATRVRAHRKRRREAAIDECVRSTGVSREEAAVAAALIKHLISADAGVPLMDRYGLSGEQATVVARWAVELVVQALKRGKGPLHPAGAPR